MTKEELKLVQSISSETKGEDRQAFKDYATQVDKTVKHSHSLQAFVTLTITDLGDLDSLANEARELWEAMPKAQRERKARCAGLPRGYPREWMATPHSNSLMFEFRELQSIPSNRLRAWKD